MEANKRSVINVRVDAKTKEEAEVILKDMGLNMSVAVNLFLRQVVLTGRIPFELIAGEREEEDA